MKSVLAEYFTTDDLAFVLAELEIVEQCKHLPQYMLVAPENEHWCEDVWFAASKRSSALRRLRPWTRSQSLAFWTAMNIKCNEVFSNPKGIISEMAHNLESMAMFERMHWIECIPVPLQEGLARRL